MPEQKRKLIYKKASSLANNEDWWTLVFDSENRSIHVEHKWSYTPLGGGETDSGEENFSLDEFLDQNGDRPEHRGLVTMIESLF